jgi:hypothetical protein
VIHAVRELLTKASGGTPAMYVDRSPEPVRMDPSAVLFASRYIKRKLQYTHCAEWLTRKSILFLGANLARGTRAYEVN